MKKPPTTGGRGHQEGGKELLISRRGSQKKSRKRENAEGKEKGKARSSIAQAIRLKQKGKVRHQNPGTSQDHADLSSKNLKNLTMTGGEHGQQLGPLLPAGAVPVARALMSHGLVPLGRDDEQEAGLLGMPELLKCRNTWALCSSSCEPSCLVHRFDVSFCLP